jgi:hypothetical protein
LLLRLLWLTLSLRLLLLLLWLSLLRLVSLRPLVALWRSLASAALLFFVGGTAGCPCIRASPPAAPAGATRFFRLVTGARSTGVRRFV